jgi:hypothetical protein
LKILYFLAFFLACSVSASALPADPAFTIAGIAHDPAGGRIPHAHVTVRRASGQPVIEAVAGDLGDFRRMWTHRC